MDRGMARRRIPLLLCLLTTLVGAPAARAAVTVTKSDPTNLTRTDGDVCPGDTLRYRVCAINTGARDELFFLVEDLLVGTCFASGSFVSVPIGATDCSGPVASNYRMCLRDLTVSPGTLCFEYDVVLKSTVPPGSVCPNQIDFWQGFDPISSNEVLTRISCAGSGPDVLMVKRASPVPAVEGLRHDYRLEITNEGRGADTDLVITDDIPDKSDFSKRVVFDPAQTVRITTSGGSPVPGATSSFTPPPAGASMNGILEVRIPSIAAGETLYVDFYVDILYTCGGGIWGFANQAVYHSDNIPSSAPRVSDNDDGDGFYPEKTSSGTIASAGTSAVTVEKTAREKPPGAPPLRVGDIIEYTVTLTNAGGCPKSDGVVLDELPAGALLDPASVRVPPGAGDSSLGPPAGANGTGRVDVDAIVTPALGTATVVFEAEVFDSAACSSICNQAGYGWPGTSLALTDPACLTVEDTAGAGSVTVVKSADRTVAAIGDTITWTLTIENSGPCPVVGAEVNDVVRDGLSYVDGSVAITPASAGVDNSVPPPGGIGNGLVDVDSLGVEELSASPTIIVFETTVDSDAVGPLCNDAEVVVGGVSVPSNEVCVTLVTGCSVAPDVVTGVKAVRASGDVDLSWEAAAGAATYNTYGVTSDLTSLNEELIPIANAATAAVDPRVVAIAPCLGVAGLACTHTGGIASPPGLRFYQVVGVCSDGITEGPN